MVILLGQSGRKGRPSEDDMNEARPLIAVDAIHPDGADMGAAWRGARRGRLRRSARRQVFFRFLSPVTH